MYLYNKYIVKTILPVLSVLTIILTSLVWIVQLLNQLGLIDKGIELRLFLEIAILLIPSLLYMILPIVSVISIIYVYNRLQEERQLIILKSAGLSNSQLAKPALFIAILVTILTYYISAYMMPVSYNNLKKNIINFKQNYVSNIIEPRTFNQISKHVTVYVDRKSSNNEMEGVILFDNKIPEQKTIFFAKKGIIFSTDNQNTNFILSKGLRHSYDSKGHLTKLHFEQLELEINNEIKDISNRVKTSMELTIPQMLWPDTQMSADKQQRLIIDGHCRIIWPMFNLSLSMLALSTFLSFCPTRKTNYKQIIYSFVPTLIAAYFHFTLQKMSYFNPDYIYLCYANILICILYSMWQNNRKFIRHY